MASGDHVLGIDPESECRVEFQRDHGKDGQERDQAAARGEYGSSVNAQQARRLLDRLVGYKISPLLWVKIKKGLSAGRVQSVATRMVVDREQEIEQFEPEEYWYVDAELRAGGKQLHARLIALDGERVSLSDAGAGADAAKARVEQGGFVIRSAKRGEKRKHPAPPFTTSNLQQEASRKLGFTTAKTMQIAQQLYEGVDIEGEGTQGHCQLHPYRQRPHVATRPWPPCASAIADAFRRGISAGEAERVQGAQERAGRARSHPPDQHRTCGRTAIKAVADARISITCTS